MTDERDLRDDDVDEAWREHVRDEPPRALDDAIRAAAHRAVQSGPRAADKPPRRSWSAWAPLAVAATLGAIALGVVQLAPHETDATREVVSDAAGTDSRHANASSPAQRSSSAARPSTLAAPSAAPPAAPPAPSATPAATSTAPVTRPPTPLSQPAATPSPPIAAARRNESDREARPPASSSALRDNTVGAVSPREADAQSSPQAANRPQAEKLAAAPDPFPAAGTDRPPEAMDQPDAKRATTANRIDGASRDASVAAAAPAPAMAAPSRKEQATEPAVDAVRRKDAAPFAEPSRDRAAAPAAPAAQPAQAQGGTLRAAPATVERASEGSGTDAQALAKTAALRTPDDYFSAIRRLRDEGREADAIATLTAYRAAFGADDQKLPGDLRLWAMRVTRP